MEGVPGVPPDVVRVIPIMRLMPLKRPEQTTFPEPATSAAAVAERADVVVACSAVDIFVYYVGRKYF
jgi:hypothetical protein